MATVNIDRIKKKILDRYFSGLKPQFTQGKYFYYFNGWSYKIMRINGLGTSEVLCDVSNDDLIPYVRRYKEEKENENRGKTES